MDSNTGGIIWIVCFLVLGVVIYFIPTIIAFMRKHHNAGAIFIINLLLGWSLIGWAIALAWAFTKVE